MWFFVHKAVWLASGRELPWGFEIDHKNSDNSHNAIDNLQLLSTEENLAKRRFHVEPAF